MNVEEEKKEKEEEREESERERERERERMEGTHGAHYAEEADFNTLRLTQP